MKLRKYHSCRSIVRHLALISVLFICALAAHSQTHYSSNVAIGVHGGIDLSKVFFNPSVPQTWPIGGTAGVMFRYIEENHFGLIAEFNWRQGGWKENFEDAPYNYRRTINYLEIPVLAHIYFGRRGRFFVNAGPQFGVVVSESTSANFNPDDIASLPGFPIRNRTLSQLTMPVHQKFDYGISAGIGGEFNINRRNALSLEVRFYYGLGNVMNNARSEVFRASNTMSLGATVGYWFRIK